MENTGTKKEMIRQAKQNTRTDKTYTRTKKGLCIFMSLLLRFKKILNNAKAMLIRVKPVSSCKRILVKEKNDHIIASFSFTQL